MSVTILPATCIKKKHQQVIHPVCKKEERLIKNPFETLCIAPRHKLGMITHCLAKER